MQAAIFKPLSLTKRPKKLAGLPAKWVVNALAQIKKQPVEAIAREKLHPAKPKARITSLNKKSRQSRPE